MTRQSEDHLVSPQPRTRLKAQEAYLGLLLKTILNLLAFLGVEGSGEAGDSTKELGNSFNEKYSPKVPKCCGL